MTQVGRAFLFEFRRRHYFGLIAFVAYLAVFSIIKFVFLGDRYPMELAPPNGMAAFVFVPATLLLMYFFAVFSYGLEGDLAARQSIYPQRLFTQPVTSAALAGWPMLYGGIAGASLYWLFAFYMRFAGVPHSLPMIWPPLLAAAYIAWMQALMWMPYGVAGLRVLVGVAWLFAFDVVIIVAFERQVSQLTMVALLAPNIPLAYLAAWYAVSRARRGSVPDWQSALSRWFDVLTNLTRRRRRFPSAAAAQAWFERRRHGRSLPWMVAMVLPFELWLVFVPGNETNATIVTVTLIVALLTPPFLAFFAAAMVPPQTPFMIARPLSTVDLAAAKLKATLWSAIASWIVALVIIPVAFIWSDAWSAISDVVVRAIRFIGVFQAIVIAALVLGTLIASTWRQLNQSLCIGLTGRPTLIKSTVVIALVAVIFMFPAYRQLTRNAAVQTAVWYAFPWVLMALVATKCALGSWIAIKVHERGLLSDRRIVACAIAWLLAVVALYVAVTWFLASPAFPRYFVAGLAILSVPLVRVSAVPLALAWSRHR